MKDCKTIKLMKTLSVLLVFFSLSISSVKGQEDIEDSDGSQPEVQRTYGTFENTKVVNLQSMETVESGILELRISHKFGKVSGGIYDLFGLDDATMRIALDYGLNDRIQIGIGRSSYEKTLDASLKYRLFWQTRDDESVPLSVLLYSSASIKTLRLTGIPYDYTFDMRMNFVNQIIIGRQFSKVFSMEIVPTILHRNFVLTSTEKNTIYAIGTAGRFKLNQLLAISSEYIYVPEGQLAPGLRNSFSLGLDIHTIGHVFQLHFTNSQLMVDKGFIGETTGNWLDGDIYFGFNIMREF